MTKREDVAAMERYSIYVVTLGQRFSRRRIAWMARSRRAMTNKKMAVMGALSVLSSHVMAALVAAIHALFLFRAPRDSWMAGTSPAMTDMVVYRSHCLESLA